MSSRPALARLLFLLLLPVFVGFVLVVLKLGRRADLSFHDWVVRWTARPSDSGRALILYIDDQTDQELPYASLTRTDYARLIRMLKDLGAAAIVLDVEFRKPSPPGSSRIDASSSPHDFALERALRYAGNVILAASYRRQGGGGGTLLEQNEAVLRKNLPISVSSPGLPPGEAWLLPPYSPFRDAAWDLGAATVHEDEDEILRRVPLYVRSGTSYYPYLGLESALRVLAVDHPGLSVALVPSRIHVEAPSLAQRTIPIDGEGKALLRWRTSVPHLVFSQLSDLSLDSSESKAGKLLSQFPDSMKTPAVAEYLEVVDRLRSFFDGDPLEVLPAPEEVLRWDRRRRELEEGLATDLDARIRKLEALSPRAREASREVLDGYRRVHAALLSPRQAEKKFRHQIENRICVVGFTGTASGDRHSTPLGTRPGVDVLANVIEMVLDGRGAREAAWGIRWIHVTLVALLVAFSVTFFRTGWAALCLCGLLSGSAALVMFLQVSQDYVLAGASPLMGGMVVFAVCVSHKEFVAARLQRQLRREFAVATSPEVADLVVRDPELVKKPRKRIATVFFSDIEGFTPLSEEMKPAVLVSLLNRYLDRMSGVLRQHGAYVDKFIGDGIMAVFGIPHETPDHARRACTAALECGEALVTLNREFEREGLPPLRSRIGIHSGELVAGYIGSSDRANYTSLGDTVNLASRLEGANKTFGTSVVLSEATCDLLSGSFVVRELDRVRVTGRRGAVRVFELVGAEGKPLPYPKEFLTSYASALDLFHQRNWSEAAAKFVEALQIRPRDPAALLHARRCEQFLRQPPPPEWEGVFELEGK